MRVMAKIAFPVESGNPGVKDGTIGKLFQAAAERWEPEAMYFGTFEGRRTGFVVFDMPDPMDQSLAARTPYERGPSSRPKRAFVTTPG